jgi:hypothetical protein
VSVRHPLVGEFLTLLEREGDAWANAKRAAFESACASLADEDGLPPASSLRQVERGLFDARLPAEWRPVFVEVLRQWEGFLLDQRHRPRHPTLTWRWWLAPPRWMPERAPDALAWAFAPAVVAALAAAAVALSLVPSYLASERILTRLDGARSQFQGARAAAVEAEASARAALTGESDESVAAFLARRAELLAAADALEAERARLAEDVRVAHRRLEEPRWP